MAIIKEHSKIFALIGAVLICVFGSQARAEFLKGNQLRSKLLPAGVQSPVVQVRDNKGNRYFIYHKSDGTYCWLRHVMEDCEKGKATKTSGEGRWQIKNGKYCATSPRSRMWKCYATRRLAKALYRWEGQGIRAGHIWFLMKKL